MPRRLAIAAVVGALFLAACGSDDDPALDTGGAPDDAATAPTSTAPAQGGEGGEPAACAPAGTALAVTAEGIKWNTDCLAVAAGEAFSISLDNKDRVPHNVAILKSHSSTDALFRGELIQGPKATTYQVPALEAGTYVFHCEVHPTQMRGTFVVAPS